MHDEQLTEFTRQWAAAEPTVLAYVRAIVRDPHLARDVVQATALVLCRKFEQWDSDRELLPWALGFAKTQILSHRRDAGRSRLVFDGSVLDAITAAWPEATAEVEPERAALRACLDTLTGEARELVRLRYDDDLPHAEVAERTGSTSGAVRTALTRIRRSLFDCITRRLRTLEENDATHERAHREVPG